MARQNGEEVVHYAVDGTHPLCARGKVGVDDPRETTCGACMRYPEWKAAWKAEAKRAKVPQ
jgi:hypothetical protein